MTVAELIEALQGMPEDAEVKIAHQPNYPLECGVGEVVEVEVENHRTGKDVTVVYVSEGDGEGYLPGIASKALGWR